MFTGIVERVGSVTSIKAQGSGYVLTVECGELAGGVAVGDSVSVSGVCLTATRAGSGLIAFDVAPQTLRLSRLGSLRAGSRVNLERAMAANGRFGGHIVQGHADGVGRIVAISTEGNAHLVRADIPEPLLRYVAPQGSIALDGISLTVATIQGSTLTVSVIPHTFRHTTLGSAAPGDALNVETDILARYVERLMAPSTGGVTVQGLTEAGFG